MKFCIDIYCSIQFSRRTVFSEMKSLKKNKKKTLLLAESRRQLEQWKNDAQSERNLNLSIPLLMQNKVPDGFEDGDQIRVDLRPESVSARVTCVFDFE